MVLEYIRMYDMVSYVFFLQHRPSSLCCIRDKASVVVQHDLKRAVFPSSNLNHQYQSEGGLGNRQRAEVTVRVHRAKASYFSVNGSETIKSAL